MTSDTPPELLPKEQDNRSSAAGAKRKFLHKTARTIKEYVEPWSFVIGLGIGIVVGFGSTLAWVRSSAQSAVLDEKFLGTLASHVRPTCIFDSRGTIEADLGAGEYIEDIRVKPIPQSYGFEVTIKAKRHLAYAPLVTGVDADLFPESAVRGKLHDWTVLLAPNTTVEGSILGDPSAMDTNKLHRFKLEILH